MPTYTPVIDNGGELYNVKAYGAVGDAVNSPGIDDAPAIGAALAAARKTGEYGTPSGQGQPVLLPSGVYRVDTPLNLVDRQMNLRGSGPHQSVLRGNTGGYGWGVLIDMTGAGFSSLRDLSLETRGMQSKSALGVLQARRNEPNADALCNNLSRVTVRMEHVATANANQGTFAVVNVGCETTTYDSVYLLADVGLFIGSGNNLSRPGDAPFAAVSPFAGAVLPNASMSVVSVRGTSNIVGISGPAVRIAGGADIDLGDSALLSQAFLQTGVPTYPYAIEVLAQTSNLRYSGSMENFSSLLWIGTNQMVVGLMLDCYAAHNGGTQLDRPRIVMGAGSRITGGRINVVPNPGTMGGTLIKAQGPGVLVEGIDIDLYAQGIDLTAGGALKSCVIRSTRTLAETMAGIVAGTRTGNVILASDGVHIDAVTTL